MAEAAQAPSKRPLSPHLQIYRLAAVDGRCRSCIASPGSPGALHGRDHLVAWWLPRRAGPNAYATFERVLHPAGFGRLILFGFSWAALHHLIGGLRHLVWDLGIWIENEEREWLDRAPTSLGSIALHDRCCG